MVHNSINVDNISGMMSRMCLSIKNPSNLDLSTSDQVLKYFALHIYIAHHISLL